MTENLWDLVWEFIEERVDVSIIQPRIDEALENKSILSKEDSLAVMRYFYEKPNLFKGNINDLFKEISERFPDYFFIQFLLACYYFDEHLFSESKIILQRIVDDNILNHEYAIWRKAKILEMLAAIDVRKGILDSKRIDEFWDYYLSLDAEDQPVALEIMNALSPIPEGTKTDKMKSIENQLRILWPNLR